MVPVDETSPQVSRPGRTPLRMLRLRTVRLSPLPFLAILLLAAVLRLDQIGQPFTDTFSWREASTAMMAENFYRQNWNIFYPEVNWNGPGPGYQGREFQTVSYAAALLYVFLGQQDWIGRSIAVVFGLWGIYALYQLVRRVWDEERALASAAVMALLPGSIAVERSFLPDPAMVALVTTSVWMMLAYLQTDRPRYLILAWLIGTWGILTKIPGLILGLPIVYAVLTILRARRQLTASKLLKLSALGGLALLPVVAYYLWARHLAQTYPPYHFAGGGNWLWDGGLKQWWAEGYFVASLSWIAQHWLWTAPALYMVVFGLLVSPRDGEDASRRPAGSTPRAPWLFHCWLLAGGVYYMIGAKELIRNPWNLHVITPAIAALTGHGLVIVTSLMARAIGRLHTGRSRWFSLPNLTLVMVLVFSFVLYRAGKQPLQRMYHRPWGDQSYVMGLALREVSQPGDLVVTMASALGNPDAIYYSRRRGWIFPPAYADIPWRELPKNDATAIQLYEELRAQGADWLAIADEQASGLWVEHRSFVDHIRHTSELVAETPDYLIYRILSPEKVPLRAVALKPTSAADAPWVTQQVRYRLPEAGQVFLVWGVNGWTAVPEELRPPGTAMKDKLMYTPMVLHGDAFVTEVRVPLGAIINYGFMITSQRDGQQIKAIWDGEDYSAVATQGGIIEKQASVARPPSK